MPFENLLSTPVKLQRAYGDISVCVASNELGVTTLKDLRQEGSMRVVFPKSLNNNFEAVIVNTAGGITSGDKFSIFAEVGEGAKLSLTTQAAERVYCASNSDFGLVQNKLIIAENAQLYWLPQETILFNGSRMQRQLNVEIATTAKFLFLEPLVFGREASGEELRCCFFKDRVQIFCNNRPIYIDGIKMNGDVADVLRKTCVGNENRALANIVLFDKDSTNLIDKIRELLPQNAGASLISENLLGIRILAASSFELRKILLPILTLLTNDTLPKNWKL